MKISYTQVEAQCNELHATAEKMKEILDKVNEIGTKIGSTESWNGSASENYSQKIREFSKSFEEIFQELENSILYMAKVTEGYQVLDSKLINEICSNLNITEPNLSTSNIFGN